MLLSQLSVAIDKIIVECDFALNNMSSIVLQIEAQPCTCIQIDVQVSFDIEIIYA